MSGEVAFTATKQDWVAANRLWYRHTKPRRILKWLGPAAFVVAFTLIVLDLLVWRKAAIDTVADAVPLMFFAILVTGLPPLTMWLIPRQVARQFAQRPAMRDEAHYAWTDEHLVGATRTGTTVQPWRELHRQLRDDRSFVFLMTDQMLLLVPRRALTVEQASDLADTADRHGPKLG